MLKGHKIVLAITGSIAAYKVYELTRLLIKSGAELNFILSKQACTLITPLSLQALSGVRPYVDTPDTQGATHGMDHITLAKWPDTVLIVPATANIMAKCALGIADCLISTLYLATKAKIVIAPAMNKHMWQHATTQRHYQSLIERNIAFIGPIAGVQACGDQGMGCMAEPQAILDQLITADRQPKRYRCVLITSGPTIEPIDAVRYISNYSSGKMGLALLEAALVYAETIIFITGPSRVMPEDHPRVRMIQVQTAKQMHQAVMAHVTQADLMIAAAAVADVRPTKLVSCKQSKSTLKQLQLTENADIVAQVCQLAQRPIVVAFAAQTEGVNLKAIAKMQQKRCDMIVANYVDMESGTGFESDDLAAMVHWPEGQVILEKQSKHAIAEHIFTLIHAQHPQQGTIEA